ncbi:sodium-dependent lysophosphatidylcholine symporter 1-A isoform X1 [Pangasianodon hypophthalmus]|uniref:sodium-dependent lysophosphatidylcholine symporter 1-A isoform X1 n=1 Tax=Pangasianodon hypophthalmus TaxID=310915 RepID=UPI002307703E|nr:sodium-dependent lysophosphatidylcholine symporter 1-A isoform X1 [Pangasianodon hypophthalmus]
MARGEGAEQLPVPLLSPVKHIGHDEVKKKEKRGVSICSKVCFAIGGAPYQITGSALGFFLQIYLLDVAQLEPFYASIILFAGRVWDAVTDPTVGFLVSRSPRTRHGRMMPWIVLSTPFAVLSYFLIWVVPPEKGKVVWYLFFYCMFQSLQTCFHVPYSALTMFISSEQKERDSATAYRMTIEVLGTVLGTAIQGQIVGGANAPCLNHTSFLNDSYNITQLSSEVNVSHVTLEDTKRAYMLASGVISIIYILCAAILFLGVREQDERCVKEDRCLSFVESLKLLQKHGPYVKLVAGFLFTSLAFMLMEGNFALFLTYTLGLRDHFQNILLVIMLSGTLTIPLWQLFLTRFGKKTAVYVGISWAVPFMILVVCIKSSLVVTYIVAIAAGASVAAAFLLPWSMLPDAVDDYKVQNPESQGHEAIFYSFYVFFTKFASGVSLGISTLSLHFAGYVSRVCVQPDSVNLTLRLLVSAAPVSLIILGLLIFRSYPINEERRKQNRTRLHALLNDSREEGSEDSSSSGRSV